MSTSHDVVPHILGSEHSLDAQDDPHIQSLDSNNVLEPGYYWTATKAVEDEAEQGDTLLLLDVIVFEERVHSVQLRVHPRHGTRNFTMLVGEFLDHFEPCSNAEAIRAREQANVLQRVSDLQNDLARTQSDPMLMIEAVRDTVEAEVAKAEKEAARQDEEKEKDKAPQRRDDAKLHRRSARRSESHGNPLVAPRVAMAGNLGGLIAGGINDAGLRELRTQAAQQVVVAQVQANWLKARTTEISETLKQLAPYLEERAAVALARSSAAIKMSRRLLEGIESLDLYIGKDVDVYDVRTGRSAVESEPLTLIQGKRFAEEELAVWADVDETFDWRNREDFFDALAANHALLEQVLPAPRCVVTMAMTRQRREYGNDMDNLLYNMKNRQVFLLTRDGENVSVVYSGIPSHEGAPRLFPTTDDLERPFRGWDGSRVSIRDAEFGASMKEFDNVALAYKRFLILLCGLDHRLGLLGRFYPADQQMQFMTAWFQEAHFRFVADEESGTLLGNDMPALRDWMAEKNQMLQSGSRVFVMSAGVDVESTPELRRRDSLKAADFQFTARFIALKEANRHYITVQTCTRDAAPEPGPQAKCYLDGNKNSAHESAWWICIDDVKLAEVRRYIHSRIHRGVGVGYLRLFRRLEVYLAAEQSAEADARAYLMRTAIEHGGMTPDTASATLDTAVRNWRASRRGAPLPGADDAAALNPILSLMVPKGAMVGSQETLLEQYLAKTSDAPLLLTRSGKAKVYLYVAPVDADREPYPQALKWGWVRRITLETTKTKMKETSSTLVWLTPVLPASEVELKRWDALTPWLNDYAEPLPLRQYAEAKANLMEAKEWAATLRAGRGSGVPEALFDKVWAKSKFIYDRNKAKSVPDVYVNIPVALFSENGRRARMVYMTMRAEALLAQFGTEAQCATVTQGFLSRYMKPTLVRHYLDSTSNTKWQLITSDNLSERHDVPTKEMVAGSWSTPDWRNHRMLENLKHNATANWRDGQTRKERGAKPWNTRTTSELSLDRAFDQLAGLNPSVLRKAFNKEREAEAARAGRGWIWDEDDGPRKRKDARKKALSQPYVHRYMSTLSPLVWSESLQRSVANAVFTAPLLAAGGTRKSRSDPGFGDPA